MIRRHFAKLSAAFICLATLTAFGQDVTFKSLLEEMANRNELPKLPKYDFVLGQASSYDRASKSPSENWFANGDGGGFIRTETNDGRKERVLMDEQGPGAIVRFWSTYLTWGFSNGTVRFYFDGSEKPQIEGKFLDIISGKMLVDGILSTRTGAFREDFKGKGYLLSGVNLYLPIPYAKSCKVTYEGVDNPFYFAINFRKYTKGTKVKTFAMSQLKTNASTIAKVQKEIVKNPSYKGKTKRTGLKNMTIAPGKSANCGIKGMRAIREFMMHIESDNYKQALRSTVIEIKFDGMSKVWAPVGDFFCTGYALTSEFNTRYHKVTFDGRMLSRWIMPFKHKAEIIIHNHCKLPVTVKELVATYSPWKWDSRSLYFNTNWHTYSKIPSQPKRDLNYLEIEGKGKYVGDSLAVFNNAKNGGNQPWWGEGDEKIYIDGETFPSHFGTGTEDYYAYAWVGCALFGQPFLGQPIAHGNRGVGLTVNSRWRALDPITFKKSLKLDMELWHWVNGCDVDYAPVTFWYGTAKSKATTVNDRLTGVKTPIRFNERIEAEAFVVDAKGKADHVVYTQPKNGAWSNRSQLLISDLKSGNSIGTQFYSGEKRVGELKIVAQKIPTGGSADLLLNGKVIAENFDMKGKGQVVKSIPNATLKRGRNILTIKGKGGEVAIDYLEMIDK